MKLKKVVKALMIILLALAVLLCGGFAYLYFNGLSGMSQNSESREGQIKVACVGDSITYGHGISNWPKNNYPARLAGLLGDGYHVQSFGVSGRAVQDNSDQPYRALEHYQKSLAYEADILVFMMGTNDSKPENWFGEDAFRTALEELLDSYLAAEKLPKIYLCTPAKAYFAEGFTENVTEYDIQPEIVETVDGIVRQIAQERGYSLIDIHALTEANPQWFEKDGVHPNNEGAAAIAQRVYEAVTQGKAE